MAFYLAIDLGTTGCRSIIFSDKLEVVSSAYEEYGLITPEENFVEQDAELWWQLTLFTIERAILGSGINSREIKGISISSQGITIVPVDENLKPLYNALSWLDMRAEKEVAKLEKDFGGEYIFKLTGKPNNAAYTLPKLMWIKENLPDIWKNTWKFLMPMDYLFAKFTGNCVTDHSMASGTLLYDIKNLCWSEEMLEYCGIDEDKLPKLMWSGECVGKVLPEIVERLGLNRNCVVGVGAQDQKCAALGAGLAFDSMTVSLGTAGAVTKLWNAPKPEEHTAVGWCAYANPDVWVTEGVVSTAGTCLRWVRDTMFKGEEYCTIDAEASDAIKRNSSLLFFPFMSEEACFFGVNLSTVRGDFAAAVMEGVAFEIRILLEKMQAYTDNVGKIIIFGGGAKGDLWCQIIADVTKKEILVPSTAEAAGAGAAMLAAKASGVTLEPLDMAKKFIPKHDYEKKFRKYAELKNKML